jgi:hypothetical protein
MDGEAEICDLILGRGLARYCSSCLEIRQPLYRRLVCKQGEFA